MKIAVITLHTPEIEAYTKYTIPLNRKYCTLHGYDFIEYTSILDENRPASWSKLIAIKEHYQNYDWIFWIDADAIFHNHDIRIEDRIDENFNLVLSKAFGPGWAPSISNLVNVNFGVFLLKGKCSWTLRFINYLYFKKNCVFNPGWENKGLIDTFLEDKQYFTEQIKIIDQYLLNGFYESLYGYYGYDKNQYILHLAGMSNNDRVILFKEQSERILSEYYNE